MGIGEPDLLLALGVVSLAVTEFYNLYGAPLPWPWATSQQGAAEIEVLPELPINFERITALSPDLILGTSSAIESADYANAEQNCPHRGAVAGPPRLQHPHEGGASHHRPLNQPVLRPLMPTSCLRSLCSRRRRR